VRRTVAALTLACHTGLFGLACASWPLGRGVRPCPVPLQAPTELGGDFTRRFQYRITTDADDRYVLELVAERREDALIVVGLTPIGSVAFALVQRGDEVVVEEHLRPLFPPPPENALADLTRADLLRADGGEPFRATLPACGYSFALRPLD